MHVGANLKTSVVFFLAFSLLSLSRPAASYAGHALRDFFSQHPQAENLNISDWTEIRGIVSHSVHEAGQVTPELQEIFYQIEENLYPRFTSTGKSKYQAILAEIGAKFKNRDFATRMPQNNTPFWIESEDDFKNYRSATQLPAKADIVIIGAGLTGSSAAYHLIEAAKKGLRVVILEATHPAAQSSGKNGGNFQLLPESYFGTSYDGLIEERLKWLKEQNPEMGPEGFSAADEEALRAKATEQARTLVQFSFLNMNRIKKIVKDENLQCDLSPHGWLRIASTADEEKALIGEIPWLTSLGAEGIELLSPSQIEHQVHIPAQYAGRLIRGSGNYHPYKFVKGVLQKALAHGIELYTRVEVKQVSPMDKGFITLETSEGKISAKQVIVATNAFTPRLFPELKDIQCVPSQVVTIGPVKNNLRGYTVTEDYGDIYYNFPQSTHRLSQDGTLTGMLLYGLDFSSPVADPQDIHPSQDLLNKQMEQIYRRFPKITGQPPTRVWVGPMGFSKDRAPTIGILREGVTVAAGFQGYGGSYCIQAGYDAAQMALTGETPAETPEELFSPKRFQHFR